MKGTVQTRADYLALPGVLEVLSATPRRGHVTLVVKEAASGIGEYLDPGRGDGRGFVPIGTEVHVVVRAGGVERRVR